ncbi:MauE/DoxX family redox-associated membrane protein [Streptomyces sp. NPDC091371]|uniref:MauE/DoxX family redox-associated membrane protein n=1 Tax=Streptomyces sp. NPDC091371 TaxID=3155303 RepID=UPI0034489AD6
MTSSAVLIGCQVFIGVVFLTSFAGKVRTPARYADFRTAAGELAPWLPAKAAAPAVVAAEAAAVVLVGLPATAPAGFAVAIALLLAFTAAILVAVRRRRRVLCQCFGTSSVPVGPVHVLRNLILLAGAGAGAVLTAVPRVPVEPAGLVTAVLCAAVLTWVTLRTDDIAELFRSIT